MTEEMGTGRKDIKGGKYVHPAMNERINWRGSVSGMYCNSLAYSHFDKHWSKTNAPKHTHRHTHTLPTNTNGVFLVLKHTSHFAKKLIGWTILPTHREKASHPKTCIPHTATKVNIWFSHKKKKKLYWLLWIRTITAWELTIPPKITDLTSDNILISNSFCHEFQLLFYLESYISCRIYVPAGYLSVYSEHLGFCVPNRCSIERKKA